MPETLSVQDPSVHQHGLPGPVASMDTAGQATQIRGLDDINGLLGSVPDGKVLQELGESSEEIGSAIQQELGGLALGGAEVEGLPLAEIDEGFQPGYDSLAPPEPVPPIQTPENPAIMNSVFELARNGEVDLETRIEAIETYVTNQEAKEDGARPGETFDDYMARLDRVTAGQEALWSPELKYAKQVLQALRTLRRPDTHGAKPVASKTPPSAPATVTSNQPKPVQPTPNQATPSQPTAQKPTAPGTQTNASSTSSTTTNTPAANSPTPQQTRKPAPATPQTTNRTSQQPKPQKSSAPAQTPAPAGQAAAAQASQGGFEAEAAQQPAETANATERTASPTEMESIPGKHDEKNFVTILSQEDQDIWANILRINDVYKDGKVNEALEALQGEFTPENTGRVMKYVEENAAVRQGRGDEFGARQQRVMATKLEQLAGHVFGRAVKAA